MKRVVAVEKVSKTYSRGLFKKRLISAVQSASLEVSSGELISIVGESGSGKTTLGKLMTGLVLPSSGRLIWRDVDVIKNGRIVNREFYSSNRHRYVYVHQDPYSALNPSKNVWDTLNPVISKYKKHLGTSDKYKTVIELLEEVGLVPADYFIDKYPHHLSGGMRQRLALARALAADPHFIVADEIVSMVDPSIRISLVNLLKDIVKARNISVVFISHDLGISIYAAENNFMYVMLNGVVVEYGPAYEIAYSPEHPYTRALISNTSVPLPSREKRVRELDGVAVEDSKPRPNTLCPFASLCPFVDSECSSFELGFYLKAGAKHFSACLKTGKLPKWKPSWLQTLSG
ncbi:MAG: ABC transporter ATP-binding protein [Sulfolobales archaeon]